MKEKKARVIYLDVNGVLYTGHRWDIPNRILKNLKNLVEGSGGQIVVSSSFRLGDWDALRSRLEQQGVPSIMGCTPRQVVDKARAIREDVSRRGDVEFVVIDDNALDVPHLIKCDPAYGLTRTVTVKALAEFSRQCNFEG